MKVKVTGTVCDGSKFLHKEGVFIGKWALAQLGVELGKA
jgi:hypothetical protein